MENASKALIMAGGIILAMLIVSLLIFAWSKFSEFYSSDDVLREVQNVAKFNEQFTAYDRIVSGYELISLANKVADYNFRYSNAENAKNDQKYEPITLIINWSGQDVSNLSYDGTNRLFINNRITQSDTSNQIKNLLSIEDTIDLCTESATKVAKAYDNINPRTAYKIYFPNEPETSSYESIQHTATGKAVKDVCVKNFNMNVKSDEKVQDFLVLESKYLSNANILKYYEYYQFKKAKFECTDIQYRSEGQGRVKSIEFKFTGDFE